MTHYRLLSPPKTRPSGSHACWAYYLPAPAAQHSQSWDICTCFRGALGSWKAQRGGSEYRALPRLAPNMPLLKKLLIF